MCTCLIFSMFSRLCTNSCAHAAEEVEEEEVVAVLEEETVGTGLA